MRPFSRWRGPPMLILAGLAACLPDAPPFICLEASACVDRGEQGACEPTGYCSFRDASCPSGRRYGEGAGDDLASQCVDACPGNLIKNPGFEETITGWEGESGTLALTDEAHSGRHAGRVCAEAATPDLHVTDSPDTVLAPVQGTPYRLTAWLRSEDGLSIEAVIRELSPAPATVDEHKAVVVGGPTWQEVPPFDYTVEQAGSGSVEVYFTTAAGDGQCFELDDICLIRVGP